MEQLLLAQCPGSSTESPLQTCPSAEAEALVPAEAREAVAPGGPSAVPPCLVEATVLTAEAQVALRVGNVWTLLAAFREFQSNPGLGRTSGEAPLPEGQVPRCSH